MYINKVNDVDRGESEDKQSTNNFYILYSIPYNTWTIRTIDLLVMVLTPLTVVSRGYYRRIKMSYIHYMIIYDIYRYYTDHEDER